MKGPKTERGKRTITIDDDLVALLLAERERHLRIAAGVPDGVSVDLSLVKLPDGALMFPSHAGAGRELFLHQASQPGQHHEAIRSARAKLGFPGLRLHDLRGTHETLLLDAGVPVHVVAARCGHDPAVLLRSLCEADQEGRRERGCGDRRAGEGCASIWSRIGPSWVQRR